MSDSGPHEPCLPLKILSSYFAAENIRCFELVDAGGVELPPFSAGSHLTVRAPNGALRKYSLCNDPQERHRYRIAVLREAKGRGGSASLVDDARVGDTLWASQPSNAFPLEEAAGDYLFIAGGIGVTPILSMIHVLAADPGARWQLYYLTRSPEATAFRADLAEVSRGSRVVIHHDHGDPTQSLDLWPILERPTRAHIYCCGPRRLMQAVRDMTGHWTSSRIHFESFVEGGVPRPEDKPFTVRLERSGRYFEIPVGKSILEVLRGAGICVSSSCESGSCGTCRTRLISGEADHRDLVLMPEEGHSQIMICVSRAKSGDLVLDL
jgi:phthalate 4,5-dioxygenase reductase component